MLGTRSPQLELFRADHVHLDYVGRNTFHGWLATAGHQHFRDDEFKEFYVEDNGRPSVPPSQLMILLLLQGFHKVSDHEAIERTRFDLRWKTALGLYDHEALCAKSTLQLFRAKMNLHGKGRALLRKSVKLCREAGVLKCRRVTAAIDTSPIFGRGAVKDTYNLIADGIAKLLRNLASFLAACGESTDVRDLARQNDFGRYFDAKSIKGAADVDWSDTASKREFLQGLVVDTRRSVRLARRMLEEHKRSDGDTEARRQVEGAAQLLEQLLLQDVTESEDGRPTIKQGVAPGRIASVHDPEMRHGRKSASTRFDGHKGEIVVDTDSGVILDAALKAGNEADAVGSLEAVERAEEALREAFAGVESAGTASTEAAPEQGSESKDGRSAALDPDQGDRAAVAHEQATSERTPADAPETEGPAGIDVTLGDCAYGIAENLEAFDQAGRRIETKQPRPSNQGRFTREDFPKVSGTQDRVCPRGHRVTPRVRNTEWNGRQAASREYRWPTKTCANCPLLEQCMKPPKSGKISRGRTIREHPREDLLSAARNRAAEPEFKARYKRRTQAEHRLSRMMQLGGRTARYFGRLKTEFQWMLAATLANLTAVVGAACGATSELFVWLWELLIAVLRPYPSMEVVIAMNGNRT